MQVGAEPAAEVVLLPRPFARGHPGRPTQWDPKPLYYQFQAELAGKFEWTYLEEGPEVWRVRIGRQ